MKSNYRVFPGKELIVVDARGFADLAATKELIRRITSLPDYDKQFEILLDLRELTCRISTLGYFELASWMAYPKPSLPTQRKIAIVHGDSPDFSETEFFALCARNRGLRTQAFKSIQEAIAWLDAAINDELSDQSP